MTGHVNNKFKDGKIPDHTKLAFKEHDVLTVQGVIVENAHIFMQKVKNLPNLQP